MSPSLPLNTGYSKTGILHAGHFRRVVRMKVTQNVHQNYVILTLKYK